jgi:DNA-binding CsgD family transcriptional regulator
MPTSDSQEPCAVAQTVNENLSSDCSFILDLIPIGIVLVDPQARIVASNATACDLLRTCEDITNDGGILRPRSSAHASALADALLHVGNAQKSTAVGFSMARANRRPISLIFIRSAQRNRIVVLFSDPDFKYPLSAPLLASLFQFTRAESSVASLMTQSPHSGLVARQLGITRNTLRNHLKSMFFKTNARNQSDLVHTLLRSPVSFRF